MLVDPLRWKPSLLFFFLLATALVRTHLHSSLVRFLDYESIEPAITCSKLTIETLEQGVKYVQS